MTEEDTDIMWHDFFVKRREWYLDLLRKLGPDAKGAAVCRKEIAECEDYLRKHYLMEFKDEPPTVITEAGVQYLLFEM